jgi:hypothetical protein
MGLLRCALKPASAERSLSSYMSKPVTATIGNRHRRRRQHGAHHSQPVAHSSPAGVGVSSAEGLSKAMHLFEPRHFIMPFLAHAVGSLAGALAAYLIAASYKAQIAYVIGAVFLCGGVAASFLIPAPTWFIALDLSAAYLPMAWLGTKIGTCMKQGKTAARKREA